MNLLVVIVLMQIAVFQFLTVYLTRSIPPFLIGNRDLPADLTRDMEGFRRQTGRLRFALGGVLILVVLAIALVWPVGPGNGKLLIAVISLTSSVAMTASYIKDRRVIQSMRTRLPEAGIRWASLERRTVWRYYHPSWEVVPIVVLALSAAFAIWATPQLTAALSEAPHNGQGTILRLYAYLTFQGILVFGLLALTLGTALTTSNVVMRLPMFQDRPEAAMALDEALRGTELRYFIAAKIGVAILLGFRQAEIALDALPHRAAVWFDAGIWILIAVLLGLFGMYILRVVKISRRVVTESGL